ncbi:MAG: YadA-like family protein, partial [Proteobacteria bacterium]|nr:YadA-like family protein [Pseudomonadota bacterium]
GGFAGTASGVVSVGAAGAERQIVNVAPGAINATSTDAINGSQLYSVASQVNTIGGQIVNIVNNANTHFYSVNGGTSADGNYANNGATAQGAIASGIGASASATNSVAMGTNASATTANSVALGANSTTGATTSTTGTNIRGTDYTFAGGTSTGVVSMGSVGGERQVTNVAAGQLNASSTDAVNGSQLYATNQAINNIAIAAGAGINVTTAQTGTGIAIGTSVANVGPGGTATYTAGNNVVLTQSGTNMTFAVNDNPNFNSVTVGHTTINNNGVSIANGPSMTTSGVDAGGKTITNVAPGVNGTDAVNVNQLGTGLGVVNNNVNALRQDVIENRKEAQAGVAGAMAMAGMPQAYLPGKSMVAAGAASFKGQTAIAIGLSKISDNGKWVTKITGSANTRGDVGVSVGAGYQW